MASKLNRIGKDIMSAMQNATERGTSAYDTTAEVRRIEGDIAWVHIAGGVDETPVKLTIAAKAGDSVQVRVGGGRAWITGNATAPPTDDRQANIATEKAETVEKKVSVVQKIADTAKKIAGNTTQYFWHTESGTDTGTHVTEKTQGDFLADPTNGGGNLLMRSNGIAIRNGLKELAGFAGNGMSFSSDDGVTWFDLSKSNNPTADVYTQIDRLTTMGTSVTLDLTVQPTSDTIRFISACGEPDIPGLEESASSVFTVGVAETKTYTATQIITGSTYTWTVAYNPSVGYGRFTLTKLGTTGSYVITSGRAYYSASSSAVDLGTLVFGSAREKPTGNGSILLGRGLASESNGQLVVGKYNVKDTANKYALIVGNGTESTPKNAFAVAWNGNIVVSGGLTLKGNESVADWVTEQETNGSWKYRKWHSGKVEAWTRWDVGTVAITTASPTFGGYRSAEQTLTIPSGIFTSAPFTVGTKTYSMGGWLAHMRGASATSITAYYGAGASTTIQNQTIDVYAWQN